MSQDFEAETRSTTCPISFTSPEGVRGLERVHSLPFQTVGTGINHTHIGTSDTIGVSRISDNGQRCVQLYDTTVKKYISYGMYALLSSLDTRLPSQSSNRHTVLLTLPCSKHVFLYARSCGNLIHTVCLYIRQGRLGLKKKGWLSI
jgi:hypothetical protein